MKFRNDISFLRAFSVLSVLFYHFGYGFFKGGFIGVDIFFVISGYLMTRIILSGFDNDNFKLLNFYKKRVERIFPAMLLMITTICIVVYILVPTQFIYTLKNAYSSSLFFSNIFYYINTGYFDQFSKFNFFLHTWSLSLEWQFYMVYPLLLMTLKPIYQSKRNRFNVFFFGLIIVSFLLMLFHNKTDNSFSFFLPYTRAWEMMIGGLAFLIKNNKVDKSIRSKIVYSCIGILLFLVYFIDHDKFAWPSYLTLLPVLFTTVILIFNIETPFFNNRIVKFFGDISYSLYLWHWPFYVLLIFFDVNERIKYNILFMVISVIIATISYYYIEKRTYNDKLKYILSFTFILFCISFIASKIPLQYLFNDKLSKLIYYNSKYKDTDDVKTQFSINKHHMSDEMKYESFDIQLPENNKRNIILLGDSHAGAFSKTLNLISKEQNFNLIQFTGDATFPIKNSKSIFKNPKRLFNYFYDEYFPRNHKNIDLIIVSSFFSGYPLDRDSNKEIKEIEEYFKMYFVPTLYIGQSKRFFVDYPTTLIMRDQYGINYKYNKVLINTDLKINADLKKYLGNKYIDILNYPIKELNVDYTPYIYDSNHFTNYGTLQYYDLIKKNIDSILLYNKKSRKLVRDR
ncbi:hypothetical protein C1637_10015 [Chryseobacterium lactis]|uniref:Acyltransferase n=1 Tax=Chryseobacterium lactis TaxID=1241981 RepID=A0A3G6RKG9_CHRLC|nr:acyltransferase family protein [Chryseobacterium lactis]AZA82153.1 acyltransferase [Chryseobacterium lactis]AZB02534.1 acyltransferase [Chryseobacterium lactis]PNW14170.1 hypothetical protein C1637_10015 [Chryseobacterium lactis]